MSTSGIAGQIFFDNTVTAHCYLHVLQEQLLPFIPGISINFEETFFQEDEAQPHIVNTLLDVLNKHSNDSVI
jgi:hypothetical protein